MLTEFDRFCISHVCADNCKDSTRRCPLADKARAATGSYPRPEDCEKVFNRVSSGVKVTQYEHRPNRR